MVEGGAQVIESFLAESSKGVIDTVIVTVAPTFVGVDGVGYAAPLGMVFIFIIRVAQGNSRFEAFRIPAYQDRDKGKRCRGSDDPD
jgi:hypothetical protein